MMRRVASLLVLLLPVLAACGDDDTPAMLDASTDIDAVGLKKMTVPT